MTAATNALTGALDIGGTKIAVGLVDDAGAIHAREHFATDAQRGYADAIARMRASLERLCAQVSAPLRGIGIGCTGPVDPMSGEIGEVDFLTGWRGSNPVRDLNQAFSVGVAMENDADAAALGEAAYGAGDGARNMVFVTVGTGIGGGILINGVLYRGVGGLHPEIGHHVIDADGPPCFCGASGCWEALARGPAIAARFAADGDSGSARSAAPTAKEVCELARAGHAGALREVAREGRYLGIGISNLVTLYAPDLIVLGGSVMESADLLMPAISEVVRRHCTLVPADRVELRTARLGRDAALIGAARVWRNRFSAP